MAAGEEKQVAAFSSRSEDGQYHTWLDPGKLDFVIEAPDHETLEVTVTVPADEDEFRYEAKLRATGAASGEVTLLVTVLDEDGSSITNATIEVLHPEEEKGMSSFTGYRDGGRFSMPAPSGKWRLRVTAHGYATTERRVTLTPGEEPIELEFRLRAE